MGNASTKESRGGDGAHRSHHAGHDAGAGASLQGDRSSTRRNRVSRADLGGILGLGGGSSSHPEHTHERRETKQEREARRLERERVARLAERERSMKEEYVDGGFLVTMGTYTGPEDFNKQIVRQLQIERKIAPFWRGLNDIDDQWTEPQIIAAARGLPVPPADQTPPDELIPRPLPVNHSQDGTRNVNNLTIPITGRTQSATSQQSTSNPGSALPSPALGQPHRTSSPFKPRGKAIAAVLGGNSRNGSTTEIMPREINLPNDPFVNGQPIEVFLYKNATECPICFLTYPPYLNQTRCCGQTICSECFVQIKRPDPHFPEGHNENDPNHNPEEAAGMLISEPACCPYCTQPDFGVTYEPPPFRRGLTYAISPAAMGSMGTAMSSSSSVNSSTLSPGLGGGNRRRTQSLSANNPNVILTDKIRPEWSTKLQAARAHQARRAAAATALHTAAFLMGNSENRAFRSRFSRRNTGGTGSANASPGGANNNEGDNGDSGVGTPVGGTDRRGNRGAATGSSESRRVEDLEEMMLVEAIRMSLASEEERKRKAEKEEKKEAKKREKADRKAAKVAAKQGAGPYEGSGGHSGHSSASGSNLSLPGLGFGRKRGNSAASNLRVEASVASAMATAAGTAGAQGTDTGIKDKGKAVDRSAPSSSEGTTPSDANITSGASAPTSRPVPSPHQPVGPSHLRQMSSASSVSTSSIVDSQPGSFSPPPHSNDPRGSGLSLGGRSAGSEEDNENDRDPSASTEPLLNFRSLAEVVGVSIEGENAGRRLSQIGAEKQAKESAVETPEYPNSVETNAIIPNKSLDGAATKLGEASDKLVAQSHQVEVAADAGSPDTPKVMVTPDSPVVQIGEDSKQLGYQTTTIEHPHQFTQ
ncbi:hypothetical protein QBC35DRAFT_250423 [Podospora australis]|uniref:Protein SIP5 n=1 Tax=Podospora australis TaxID=1536484 RepID=A0AAN7AH54_9PEZI|nr:hypothetical protein QBC35DRAFT_250423 [Podospora australis]